MNVATQALTVPGIDLVAHDRDSMDRALTAAVEQMTDVAVRLATHGILVTRLDDTHFQVELSTHVPFGYTEQRDCRA